MQASNRLIVNTLAQYVRTLVNILLTLYSARLILEILGVSDFGLYTLVAGVVSMLQFLTNSMVASTQRFLSVAQGKQDNAAEIRVIFNSSMIVHLCFGVVILLVMGLLTPVLFNGFLNIPAGKNEVARTLYFLVLLMVFFTFITAPYRACLIARENIVYISVVDVLDAVIRLVFIIMLKFAHGDRLILYGCIMMGVQVFNLLALGIYGHIKFDECRLPRLRLWNSDIGKRMLGFAGWTMYSTFCIVSRNQGIAIVLNKALSTVINAAYGIGMQISNYLAFLCMSLMTAVSPQLMKAVGGNRSEHAMYLAQLQSKISYMLLGVAAIPVMIEINFILRIWLKDVPPYTALFSVMFIASLLVDQLTTGLGTMVNATGRIRKYAIWCYTPKLLILPVSYVLLKLHQPLWTVALLFFMMETFIMFFRLVLLRKDLEFKPSVFMRNVLVRILAPTVLCFVVCLILNHVMTEGWGRFLAVMSAGIVTFTVSAYFVGLDDRERAKARSIATDVISKVNKFK